MTRYIVLPTLVLWALGFIAGWALRGEPQRGEEPLKVGPVAWDWTASRSPFFDEVLACRSRLDRCKAESLAAATLIATPPSARKRRQVGPGCWATEGRALTGCRTPSLDGQFFRRVPWLFAGTTVNLDRRGRVMPPLLYEGGDEWCREEAAVCLWGTAERP